MTYVLDLLVQYPTVALRRHDVPVHLRFGRERLVTLFSGLSTFAKPVRATASMFPV